MEKEKEIEYLVRVNTWYIDPCNIHGISTDTPYLTHPFALFSSLSRPSHQPPRVSLPLFLASEISRLYSLPFFFHPHPFSPARADTRSSRTAFWITPRTMRSLGVGGGGGGRRAKEVESRKTRLATLATFHPPSPFPFVLFFLSLFSREIRDPSRSEPGHCRENARVPTEFYLAENFSSPWPQQRGAPPLIHPL